MTIVQTSTYPTNPVTGTFGTGNIQFFTVSGVWLVPVGIGKVRARIWGAGGAGGTNNTGIAGGGGGFSLITVYNLYGVTSIPITVAQPAQNVAAGANGGTSSFGSYASATGGNSSVTLQNGGFGIGGDINYIGGSGSSPSSSSIGGGGSASLFGNGGNGAQSGTSGNNSTGGAGGGAGNTSNVGGGGFFTFGAVSSTLNPTSVFNPDFSPDFIGTGTGGGTVLARNGGGGCGATGNPFAAGSFPGGGGGYNGTSGSGLVIVEW